MGKHASKVTLAFVTVMFILFSVITASTAVAVDISTVVVGQGTINPPARNGVPSGFDYTFTVTIFTNIVLADEINRAPAKVQSALLEAMQDRQVTIGDQTFKLEDPFLVLATQNPIEHEGTYPLPEAQVDRFMLKLHITYPDKKEEREILDGMALTRQDFKVKPRYISCGHPAFACHR